MTARVLIRLFLIALPGLIPSGSARAAQNATASSGNSGAELQFVVILTRHGVRSPTGKTAQYAKYSAAPWPEWDVQPGYLTPHGYQLMKLFGAYDRRKLVAQGLLAPTGCGDAARTTILADSDQRTRETGKALSEGLLPGCTIDVQALPEGTNNPLFHSHDAAAHLDPALAAAAIAGRIGGDANNLTEAYRPQLAALDRILAGCGHAPAAQPANSARTSLFDVPAILAPGANGHSVEFRGPVETASSLTENLLLEYAQGFKGNDLGWGCLDEPALREVMDLHTAQSEFGQRTLPIARSAASNLLDHILRAMDQSASGKLQPGAPGKPGDTLLLLVGHDTNIATVAGALGLDWIIDGRRDDTPPGGALVFELWRSGDGGANSVRAYYTAQTLDQMREAQPLTPTNPPQQVPLFIPGCSRPDLTCSWDAFDASMRRAIDPAYVSAQP